MNLVYNNLPLLKKIRVKKNNCLRGFTLLELLIVMTIVGVLISFVGPLAIDSLSKAQARSELQSFSSWLKFQGEKAFVTGQSIELELDGNSVMLVNKVNSQATPVKQFEYLFLHPSHVEFNQNGVASVTEIEVGLGDRTYTIKIDDWTVENEV